MAVTSLGLVGARQVLGEEGTAFIHFHFISHRMEFDRGDSFPFDFEPNRIPFGSKSKRRLSLRSHSIQFERNRNFLLLIRFRIIISLLF